jgi:hypothetical protein
MCFEGGAIGATNAQCRGSVPPAFESINKSTPA